MSRINELKKQYPELNITMFDLMVRLDTTKTHKYLPLMCKIFGKRFDVKEMWRKDELSIGILELQSNLINKGISTDGLTDNQMFYLSNYITENFTTETYHTLNLFMEYMDKNMIEKNDVTSYKDIDDIRGAVTLATMKELTKELEGQVIKEYEDEKWVVVRPLTFSSSAKYGASTRWCTTYQREKNYFEKYWRKGILVYFINKQTGYKFAGYKAISEGDSEFSFWNAEDSRVDYLDVDADDYLFPIVRNIFKSKDTNKNLCSDEIQQQVHNECLTGYEKMRIEFSAPDETIPLDEQAMEQPTRTYNYQREMNTIRELLSETENDIVPGERQVRELINNMDMTEEITNVPTMRA
jgi:hypothetical protein